MINECKLFLISSVTYTGNVGSVDSYVEVMRSFVKKYPNVQKADMYKHLNGGEVFYSESEMNFDVSQISAETAIDRAREFSMCLDKDFCLSFSPLKQESNVFHVESCEANLLYDSHAFFAIIYEIKINYNAESSENDVIASIFKNRDIFENLNISEHAKECKNLATDKIEAIVKGVGVDIDSENIQFEDDNTLPFILFPVGFEVDRNQFRNEEALSSIGEKSQLAADYKNAFFHPGWNYTVASGFPKEVFINLIQMTIKAQSFFFSLAYMKAYYTKELNKTISQRDSIAEFHVDIAGDVQLAFYDMLAKFYSYKNKLFPKYHVEFCALMDRWHCDEDIGKIKSYIDLDLQSKNRIHSAKIEKQNDRQNKALVFIALIQLVSVYGALADGNTIFLENKTLFLFGTVAWMVSIFVFLMVSNYLKLSIFYLAAMFFPLYWVLKDFNLLE